MQRLMTGIDRILSAAEDALLWASAASLALIMLVMSIGAASRYLFGAPITGIIDLVQIYLAPAVTFLAISAALRVNEHISIDILMNRAPDNLRRISEVVAFIFSTIVFGFIAYQASLRAYNAWEGNDVVYGSIIWPLYPAYTAVALGTILLVFRHILLVWQIAIGQDPQAKHVIPDGDQRAL